MKLLKGHYLFKNQRKRGTYCLSIKHKNPQILDKLILSFFSKLNNFPTFKNIELYKFRNSNKPIFSCIILLNNNAKFIENFLVPSIIDNTSKKYPLEIIVVDIGINHEAMQHFNNLLIFNSTPNWISKGYNAGAKKAKGKYLAFFHDDCIMNDPNWIEKSLSQLNDNVYAVTPEIQNHGCLIKLKVVPLVMERRNFSELEMFDENYFSSQEDLDLTYKILFRNKDIKKIRLNYFHYEGMSTLSLIINSRFKDFFAYNIVPKEIIKIYKEKYLAATLLKNYRSILLHDLKYFERKWRIYYKRMILSKYDLTRNSQKNEFSVLCDLYGEKHSLNKNY